ncbi:MAG: UvrD-helicase domain-containing protein [Mariprofundaceae bacterium]|nr:UvrD-helicase domain-containing protein [Mariprofundaceae bacterium]
MFDLNTAQQQAVEAGDGPQLILAGAGSGKTRTIVHRIGHLIATKRIAPHRILAVTFTNKAAAELKNRLSILMGDDAGVLSGTFHALSLRFLRRYADALGFPKSFQVIDSDDQRTLVKRLLKGRNIASSKLHPSYLIGWIEQCKHEGLLPEQAPEQMWSGIDLRELYVEYQRQLRELERMDFSDLILNTVCLLRNHPDISAALRCRFDHVLVDEYQDTNPVQHEWLTLLCAEHHNLTVVGDDDQSIYGWRGADVRHILEFEHLWVGVTVGVHRLEENYRSTPSILKLANAVIDHNNNRHAKILRATREDGLQPAWRICNDEYDEARQISVFLKKQRNKGVPWDDMAVLYRSNRQSLALEQLFRRENMSYQIIGGVGFFERLEIKDALSFWALLNGCADSMHLLRVVNKPKRGIGLKGQQDIMAQLASSGQRAADWLNTLAEADAVGAAKKLQPLAQLLVRLRVNSEAMADRGLMALLEQTSYIDSLQSFGELEAESRLDNIRTLQSYIEVTMQEDVTPIEVMDRAALLQSGEEDAQEDVPKINLMSLHRAKGLEFDTVVVAGVEEGLLPHQRALDEGETGIAEERRLLYVGITRAKNALLLTSARQRKVFGDMHYPLPSQFIKTLPETVLHRDLNQQIMSSTASAAVRNHDSGLLVGCCVSHPSFGEGIILSLEGSGDATRVSIEFERVGLKRLMLKYAALSVVS